jgi:hypothetical protein
MVIDSGGNIAGFGRNTEGQLGLGDNVSRTVPTTNVNAHAKGIACGSLHSHHLSTAGNVFSTGLNGEGELGLGTTTNANSWQLTGAPYIDIACGLGHSLARMSTGTLVTWGDNDHGQLGDGTNLTRLSPVLVPGLPYCSGFATGIGNHSVALTTPPVLLSAVKVSPATVTAGTSSVGTVTLSTLAGPGGQFVTLSSSNAAASVPGFVFVPAGAKTATFAITTKAVGAVTKVTIKGTLEVSKTAVLTVNP